MFKILHYTLHIALSTLITSGCATTPSPVTPVTPGIYHIVGSGQTLYRIAKTYGVDLREIIRINNIQDPSRIGVGEKIFIPGAKTHLSVEPYKPAVSLPVEKIVGPKHKRSIWKYITLHHSATFEGNAEKFDKNHRRRGMGGLFYHFVIGNGTDSSDGEIEVGWRWMRQVKASRDYDIQICLVGNFNRQQVSPAQFESLVKLVKTLCLQYNIRILNIRRHKDIANRFTECPGKNFPYYRLLVELRKQGLK
jgi:LysM repeat protein